MGQMSGVVSELEMMICWRSGKIFLKIFCCTFLHVYFPTDLMMLGRESVATSGTQAGAITPAS